MRAIVEKVNFKRGLVTYEIDGYDYGWFRILLLNDKQSARMVQLFVISVQECKK